MADGEEESFVARRTESIDAGGISKLIKRNTEAIFGRINIDHLIEHANFSISLVSGSGSGEVLGLLSLLDYPAPQSCSVDQTSWEEWLQNSFTFPKATPVNCLFLHLFVAKDGYHQSAIAELLKTAFISLPLLHFVFLTCPAETQLGPVLSAHFTPVPTVAVNDDETPPTCLWVTQRHQHFPVLHVRTAQVEDADDLMPIFEQCCAGDVHEQYGEYFLAELIESQDDNHKTVVAEVEGQAIGFMSVSCEVDVDFLNDCYQLESFHGLKYPQDSDEVQTVTTEGTGPGSLVTLLSSSGKSFALPGEGVGDSSGGSCHGDQLTDEDTPVVERGSLADMIETKLTGSQPQIVQSGLLSSTSAAGTENKVGDITEEVEKGEDLPQTADQDEGKTTPPTAEEGSGEVEERSENGESGVPVTEQGDGAVTEAKSKLRKKKYILMGGASALAVQLFGIDDRYEMRSIDFLPMVFQLFPDHDYLVLSQPPSMPDFPLLQMFTHVPPRVGTTVSQQLFVLHKCALLHSFAVSRVQTGDIEGVTHLVAGLEKADRIISDVTQYTLAKRDPSNEGGIPISAVVAKCAGQIVGVAVVRTEQEIGYIRSHFNIEDFIYFNHYLPTEHAHLNHFILNPVFAPYSKHMIKELLRLSSASCLYYPVHSNMEDTLATALSLLVPVLPRRQLVYPPADLGINKPLQEVTEVKSPYALYHTNRKLTLEPKLDVSSRIVIVGASDTALSLLEHLVFNPHLHFTNIVLVSPHGIPKAPPTSLAQSCCYTEESLCGLGLSTWINVVRGYLTALDREHQSIRVMSSDGEQVAVLAYDYLVLTTGLQYHLPRGVSQATAPKHVFTVNDSHQEIQLLQWVRERLAKREQGDLVVYGGGMDAYCMVHAVLEEGLPGERLVLAIHEGSAPVFTNQEIADAVSLAMEGLGVRVRSAVELCGLEDDGDSLTGLQLRHGESTITLPCAALVYLQHKQVDKDLFKAVNDSYLVFDNRLVISTDHSTNDPLIFAAGPLTKFSRKYQTDKWTHCQFNSSEVGQKLAATLLSKLDPTVDVSDTSDDNGLLPRFTKPKVVHATLPGSMHYLLIHKPRLEEQVNQHNKEYLELVTRSQRGYFRLCVTEYGCIGEVEVLSRQGSLPQLSNYLCLYDIHEKYLNNLIQRYNDQLINDFFEYFEEPWACAVFHDRFSDFVEEVREYLGQLPTEDGSGESLEDCVKGLVEEDPLSPLTIHRPSLQTKFENSPVKKLIHQRLFKYLHYNSQHLTMYARPDMM